MLAVTGNLTFSEFQLKYGNLERSYEYWFGRAVPKGMPTWIHGYLQSLIGRLLEDVGYIVGSEVELRIVSDAHPIPDIIGTLGAIENPYPTRAVDVVVEILSPDDTMAHVIDKCLHYQEWGFPGIYVVHPEQRLLLCWTGHALETTKMLTSIPAQEIWSRLDAVLARK